MPGMSQLGFSGGFLSGLAQSIDAKRARDLAQQDRTRQHALSAAQFLLDSGQVQDISDVQPLLELALPDVMGKQAGKPKKGQVDPQQIVTNVLGQAIKGQALLGIGPTAQPQAPSGGLPGLPGGTTPEGGQAPLPPTPISAQPPPAARKSLFGIPLLTPEEASQRKLTQAMNQEAAVTTARIDLARNRILPALKAVDPSATLDDALAAVGIRLPREMFGAATQSIAGEVNGKPAFAVFNRQKGTYEDPVTHQPMQGFTPRTTTGSTTLGQYAERAAGELGFGSASQARAAGKMAEVDKRAEEIRASEAGSATTARGEAASKVPLSSNQRFQAIRDLQGDWRKVDAPYKETQRQYQVMQTGLKRFKEGDKNGGSQAVLVTFQKILDPNSVVRESEYDRSPEGLGLKQRMQGWLERLSAGGAGVPAADLEQMVQTAKEFLDGMSTYNDLEKQRISAAAKEGGFDPGIIFGTSSNASPTTPATPTGSPAPQYFLKDGKWVRKP